jgi:hypothetical protein
MLQILSYILPVLLPSWRFFERVEASPRVEYRLEGQGGWQLFQPRPPRVTLAQMPTRLVWNPQGNDALFVTSCAERIAEHPTDHSIAEIGNRIAAMLAIEGRGGRAQFRLVFVARKDGQMIRDVVFVSELFGLSGPRAR